MARSLRLWVRVDREEIAHIRAKAKKYEVTVAEYVRIMCGHSIKRSLYSFLRGKRTRNSLGTRTRNTFHRS